KYSWTVIFHCGYITTMESAFSVLAEPNRRAILGMLCTSERSVGGLKRRRKLPQPSVSKHLKVLKEVCFVDSRAEAQGRADAPRAGRSSHVGPTAAGSRFVPAATAAAERGAQRALPPAVISWGGGRNVTPRGAPAAKRPQLRAHRVDSTPGPPSRVEPEP